MTPSVAKALSKKDPQLREIIKKVGAPKIPKKDVIDPYPSLIEAVIYQQLNGKAAATILQRFKSLFPKTEIPAPKLIIKTSDEKFRAAGVSGAKTRAIKDIDEKKASGFIPSLSEMDGWSDEKIVNHLTQIRGVGPWTVEMFLIFRLRRPDVMPATDYGIRQGFKKVYRKRNLPDPKFLIQFSELWRPYRSTASWYLWRSLDIDTL